MRRLRAQHGEDLVLDLQANAYGFGLPEVSALARDTGFRRAHHTGGEANLSALAAAAPHSPGNPTPFAAWWEGAGDPVSTFSARVVSLKRVPAGSAVSYGYQYETSAETTLALVCAGFADGVPRTASHRASMAIRGHTFPIAGRIAMDQCVLDCGDSLVELGDEATIWGDSPELSQWSTWSKRSQGELVCHIGARVTRQWT